jgi:hypothetical protein
MSTMGGYSPVNRRGIKNTNDRQDEDKNRAGKEESARQLAARLACEKIHEDRQLEKDINWL